MGVTLNTVTGLVAATVFLRMRARVPLKQTARSSAAVMALLLLHHVMSPYNVRTTAVQMGTVELMKMAGINVIFSLVGRETAVTMVRS